MRRRFNELPAAKQSSVRSLMQLVVEHEQKLADYMANPAAFDNLGRLKNATTAEIRQMIIDGRILKLHNEIIGFKDQIHQLLGD